MKKPNATIQIAKTAKELEVEVKAKAAAKSRHAWAAPLLSKQQVAEQSKE